MSKIKTSEKKGRNKKWCEAYRASATRAVNKAKRLYRHLRRFPMDNKAFERLRILMAVHGRRTGVSEEKLEQIVARKNAYVRYSRHPSQRIIENVSSPH